ncbi:MAG: hypothetical protein KA775_00660 [Ottowia sp.]|nr:hypothetical protein [Ottowia sp.]
MSKLATPLYLLAVALMALLLAALWLGPGPLAAWRQWQAPPAQAPNLDDVRTALLRANPAAAAAYPAVLDRPLLNPERRAQAAAGAAAARAPAPTAIEQVRLQGIVAGSALRGVMLEEQGKTRFVRVGERVGDWTLERVNARDAVFQRGGQQRRIELTLARSDAPAPVAGPAARPPSPAAAPAARPAPVIPAPVPAAPAPAPAPAPAAVAPAPAPAPAAAASAPAVRSGAFGGGAPAAPPAATGAKR